jgi:hypothetical protein
MAARIAAHTAMAMNGSRERESGVGSGMDILLGVDHDLNSRPL